MDEPFSAVFAACVLAALIAWVISTGRADTGRTGAAASQAGPPERTERRQERRHERSATLAPGLSGPPPVAFSKVPDSQRAGRSKNSSSAEDLEAPKSWKIRDLAQLPRNLSGIVPSKATPTLAEMASTTSSAAPPAPQSSVMKFVTATSSSFLASLTASGSEQEEIRHLYRHHHHYAQKHHHHHEHQKEGNETGIEDERERKPRRVWYCVSLCFRGTQTPSYSPANDS